MTWQTQIIQLHDEWYKANFPAVHRDGLTPRCPKFDVRKTADLTKAIILYIKYSGGDAERRSTTGQPREVNGKMILVKTKRGAGDIDVTYQSRAIEIEVKNKETKDRLGLDQFKRYQRAVKAGRLYFIAETMEAFWEWFERVKDAVKRGDYPLYYPKPYEADTIDYDMHPLVADNGLCISLQQVYQRPGPNPDLLPTLAEWKTKEPVKDKQPKQGNVVNAYYGEPPGYYKMPHRPELNQYAAAFAAMGYRVAQGLCLHYTLMQPNKAYKRLPKGFTLVDTPIDSIGGMTWEKRIVDRNGAQALEWEILMERSRLTGAETVTGFTRRMELNVSFCIPDFIISKGNEVFVIDCKPNTNDFKIAFYVKVLQWIMTKRGDMRKVTGGVINTKGSRWKEFKL